VRLEEANPVVITKVKEETVVLKGSSDPEDNNS
jgi:hypothetical protein